MARTEKVISVGSLVAAVDLSAKLHFMVKISAANTVNLAGAGETAVGVLMNKPVAADPAEVGVGVILPIVAGAAITAGDDIAPDALGKARTAITDDHVVGIALEDAGAAGREFACLMLPQTTSFTGDTVEVGVAATSQITALDIVCLDLDGYLVKADDASAESFWGIALDTVNNSAGADGALDCTVRRYGTVTLVSSGLAATDEGKEVWQTTNNLTVTTTPGTILVGIIDKVISAISCSVRYKAMAPVGQRVDRQREIFFMKAGATLNGTVAFENREFLRRYVVLAGYADVSAAPGGTDDLDITLTDGATTFVVEIVDTATHGENKTPASSVDDAMLTTDTDVTLTDSGTTSADVVGMFLVEDL